MEEDMIEGVRRQQRILVAAAGHQFARPEQAGSVQGAHELRTKTVPPLEQKAVVVGRGRETRFELPAVLAEIDAVRHVTQPSKSPVDEPLCAPPGMQLDDARVKD